MLHIRRLAVPFAFVALGVSLPAQAQLSIVIHAEPTLAGNTQALADFNLAASTWTNLLTTTTPVTINIDADVTTTGFSNPSIIGQTQSALVYNSFDVVRNELAAQAVTDPTHDAITAFLPTSAQFNATVGTNETLSKSFIVGSLANFKAIGDTTFNYASNPNPGYDGIITFNSAFNFNYATTGAVPANQLDFLTVATHEIGHLLGFNSWVDQADYDASVPQSGTTFPEILDLYRFSSAAVPTTNLQFTTDARDLAPNSASTFSDTVSGYSMATGALTGDGSQASHWKDDGTPNNASSLNPGYIGIMDPTLPSGLRENITAADLRAFDLMGYTLKGTDGTPEPASVIPMAGTLLSVGSLTFFRRRRTRNTPT